MKVLLLASGRSKRMKPIKDKNFLSFLGKPLIMRQIEMLIELGLKEIVLVGGVHNLEELKGLASDLGGNVVENQNGSSKRESGAFSPGISIEVVEQEDLDAGMCGGVLAGKGFIEGEMLVVSNNDVVEPAAIERVLEIALDGGDDRNGRDDRDGEIDCLMVGKKMTEYFPGGYLVTDDEGMISGIIEKPESGKEPSDLINLVIHYHKDAEKLFNYLEQVSSDNDDKYEVALDTMIKDGMMFKAVPYDGYWQSVKYPWHVIKIFKYFFGQECERMGKEERIDESAVIAETAVIKGDVIIGKNVKIFDNAVINGPVYIGDNSVIANNCLVRESHVGENCVIGYSTEVARSFLGSDVWTHSNYIGDCVISNNVSFGAGTVTGNLRLDEKNICVNFDGKSVDSGLNKLGLICGENVRVGVNTSFMPGVKVGAGSFVGAGITVSEDIEEKSFVRAKTELKISENKCDTNSVDRSEFKDKIK